MHSLVSLLKDNLVRFSYWLWFTVLLSLAPLLFGILRAYSAGNASELSVVLTEVISGGELLILCIPIISASIVELLVYERKDVIQIWDKVIQIWLIGIGFLLFFLATGFFVDMSAAKMRGVRKDEFWILALSFATYISTLLVGVSTIILTNSRQRDN
jgi:hypothetical protein